MMDDTHHDVEDDSYRKCFECENRVHEDFGRSCDDCDEWICNECQETHEDSRSHYDAVKARIDGR